MFVLTVLIVLDGLDDADLSPPMQWANGRVLARWTTRVGGEPAEAYAVRLGNSLIVQYQISERVFFRNPDVRQAVLKECRAELRDLRCPICRDASEPLVFDQLPFQLGLDPFRDELFCAWRGRGAAMRCMPSGRSYRVSDAELSGTDGAGAQSKSKWPSGPLNGTWPSIPSGTSFDSSILFWK